MGRPKKVREPLPPIWEASDELWAMIAPILAEHDPQAGERSAAAESRNGHCRISNYLRPA